MGKETLRIISPNGHLGFAPTKEGSFYIGAATHPDYYCCDSGSDDIGPVPLGMDKCASHPDWQYHDLELMLLAAREQGVPMIIGSAGDTGTNSRVDMYVDMIRDMAKKHGLKKFKLAYFYSEVDKEYLRRKMLAGEKIEGLNSRSDLTIEELDATTRIVAVAGVHPFIKALEMGADVIIGGRTSDACENTSSLTNRPAVSTTPNLSPLMAVSRSSWRAPALWASGIWVLRVFVILIPFKISTR